MADAMSPAAEAALIGVFALASAVWVGGFIAIVVVARIAGRTLRPPERVAFFRGLGRAYGPLGGLALAVALGTGAVLVSGHPWNGLLATTTAVAAALVGATAAGVLQARRMTRLRRASLGRPDDATLADRVRDGARRAAALRATIGALTLALVGLGAILAA